MMQLRLMQAFSGNNSGAYALLGTFTDVARVDALSKELGEVFEAHAKWLEASPRPSRSPLAELASRHGIEVDPSVGTMDDWPHYGTPPQAIALGDQLLVFVDCAVTFPRFLGEVVYKSGGRVGAEIDHAHDPIVLVHEIWREGGWKTREETERVIAACRLDAEEGVFAALHESGEDHERRPKPVVLRGQWPGMLTLVHAPIDVVAGAAHVRALVERHGLRQRVRLFEAPSRDEPFRAFGV